MKTIQLLIYASTLFGMTQMSHSQGYIVPNGVTQVSTLGHDVIQVVQNPANGDYTGFSLDPQGGDIFLFNPLLDEGVRTFLVSQSAPVSLEAIQTAGYTELLFPNAYAFGDGVPFYVGLYTGYLPNNGIYQNPLYGWAQLVNNGGVIELLDGALAYGADGIYAGTTTLIPEPSVLNLVGLGLVAVAWQWKRHKRAVVH